MKILLGRPFLEVIFRVQIPQDRLTQLKKCGRITRYKQRQNQDSSRATNFMTPKNKMATAFRNEVLDLAKTFHFARRLINSGRLSTPYTLPHSPLKKVDYKENNYLGKTVIDFPLVDCNGVKTQLIDQLSNGFNLLSFSEDSLPHIEGVNIIQIKENAVDSSSYKDVSGFGKKRYDNGNHYLLRPDSYIIGVFEEANKNTILKYINEQENMLSTIENTQEVFEKEYFNKKG